MTLNLMVLRFHRIPFYGTAGEAILKSVEQQWAAMRAVGAQAANAPAPTDDALTRCFILEREGARSARFRLVGRSLRHVLGRNVEGRTIGSLFNEDAQETLGGLIAQVCEGPSIVELPLDLMRGFGRRPVRGRLLMLPLTDRRGEITRIFGTIVLATTKSPRSLEFAIDQDVPMRCKTIRAPKVHVAKPPKTVVSMSPPQVAPTPLTPKPSLKPKPPAPAKQVFRPRLVVDNDTLT